jgi:hypothetical protein
MMNSESKTKPSSAAKRMRDYRERRREGWRCVRLTIHDGNIKALVEKGYLEPHLCEDRDALEIAIDNFIHREL